MARDFRVGSGHLRATAFGVYGVVHAANEFILRYCWQVVYLTLHENGMPDLAIRRPLSG